MRFIDVAPDDIVVSSELSRSSHSKQFEERLMASIAEIGLAEPIKVARRPGGKYLVVDGVLRLRAISEIRRRDPSAFATIPAYVVDYSKRFELRYQTDIYQDLLPSQLASLVEHLHKTENVPKSEIARFIGVSPATLRNYTGLWRMCQRGGIFAGIVELMDVGVIPASNPYAWLRLTAAGARLALEQSFTGGERAERWIHGRIAQARRGDAPSFPIKFIESVTSGLPTDCYREDRAVRSLKRRLGLRRASGGTAKGATQDAIRHLARVSAEATDPLLRTAARSLRAYLR